MTGISEIEVESSHHGGRVVCSEYRLSSNLDLDCCRLPLFCFRSLQLIDNVILTYANDFVLTFT